MKKMNTRALVKAALLTALSIILTRYLVIMPSPTLRLSIGFVPIMLAGILYGPLVGGAVGLVADVIGLILNAQGTPYLGFTISSILEGVLPGLVSIGYLKKDFLNTKKVLATSVISALLVGLIIHIGLNTLWLSHLMGKGFSVLIIPRAIKSAITTAIAIVLLPIFVKVLADRH